MVQNDWNIYYCIYNMNHFIYIIKTTNVFNTFLLCRLVPFLCRENVWDPIIGNLLERFYLSP